MATTIEQLKEKYIVLRDTFGIQSIDIWQSFLTEIKKVMIEKDENWKQLCILTEIKLEEAIEEYNSFVDEHIEIVSQKDNEDDSRMFAQMSSIGEYQNAFE